MYAARRSNYILCIATIAIITYPWPTTLYSKRHHTTNRSYINHKPYAYPVKIFPTIFIKYFSIPNSKQVHVWVDKKDYNKCTLILLTNTDTTKD